MSPRLPSAWDNDRMTFVLSQYLQLTLNNNYNVSSCLVRQTDHISNKQKPLLYVYEVQLPSSNVAL